MASTTVAETRDNLSAIVNGIISGAESEHIICRRNTPVAKIVPYTEHSANSQPAHEEPHAGGSAAEAPHVGARQLRTRAESEPTSAFGLFAQYADRSKRSAEKDAWLQAAIEKHAQGKTARG